MLSSTGIKSIKNVYFTNYLIFLKYKCIICNDRHFDDVITWTRGGTQMGELVEIVANTPNFNLILVAKNRHEFTTGQFLSHST